MSEITHARVARIAVPVVLSNATVPLLGAVDTAVIGQLGQAAPLGAVGMGAVILATLYWAFGFLRMSTSGLAAQAEGAGDLPERSAVLLRAHQRNDSVCYVEDGFHVDVEDPVKGGLVHVQHRLVAVRSARVVDHNLRRTELVHAEGACRILVRCQPAMLAPLGRCVSRFGSGFCRERHRAVQTKTGGVR